jgi:erlin
MHIAQQRSRSDAEYYQMQRQADANTVLLTPQYLELRKYEAIAHNNKIFFGNDIPNMFVQGGCNSDSLSQMSKAADFDAEEKVETQ